MFSKFNIYFLFQNDYKYKRFFLSLLMDNIMLYLYLNESINLKNRINSKL